MDFGSLFEKLRWSRADLVALFAAALVLSEGRRAGDPETRVTFDRLLPNTGQAGSGSPRARWRLRTAATRLHGARVARDALAEWHRADAAKGRRLIAADLANSNRVAAILSWHFEPDDSGRPHLVTSAACRHDVGDDLYAEYLVALWLLLCVAAAIDRRTIDCGRIGVVQDNAIDLSAEQLQLMGFRRGPAGDGYRGDYFVLDS